MSCKGMSVIAGAALVAAGFVGGSMVTSSFARQQEHPSKGEHPGKGHVDPQAMQDAYMKAGALGAEHERLAQRAGKWNVSMKHWMDPTAPPEESQATATMKMIMDGRYMVEHFEGTTMGMAFQGMGITAYDNIDKKLKMVWLDNFSTGIMTMEGERNGSVITTYGKMKDPFGEMQTMKAVCDESNPDSAHCEFFMKTPDGGWMKNMELHYTRAK